MVANVRNLSLYKVKAKKDQKLKIILIFIYFLFCVHLYMHVWKPCCLFVR